MEQEMQIERLKSEEGLGCVFLKIDLVIDGHFNTNTKTDRILTGIRELCKKDY